MRCMDTTFSPTNGMRSPLYAVLVSSALLFMSACSGAGDAAHTPTAAVPTLNSSAAQMDTQPTPLAFTVQPGQTTTPATNLTDFPPESTTSADAGALAIVGQDGAPVEAGGFRMAVHGSIELAFDSRTANVMASYQAPLRVSPCGLR